MVSLLVKLYMIHSIEMQIQSAYKSQPMHTRLGDSMQGNRQTISEYLSEYETEVVNKKT